MENIENKTGNQTNAQATPHSYREPIPYTEPCKTTKEGWEITHNEETPSSVALCARRHYVLLTDKGELWAIDEEYWPLANKAKAMGWETFSIVRMIPVVYHHYEKLTPEEEQDTKQGDRLDHTTPGEGEEGAVHQ